MLSPIFFPYCTIWYNLFIMSSRFSAKHYETKFFSKIRSLAQRYSEIAASLRKKYGRIITIKAKDEALAKEIYDEILNRLFKKEPNQSEHIEILDGLLPEGFPTVRRETVDHKMTFNEGVRILLKRTGLSTRRAVAEVNCRSCVLSRRKCGNIELMLPKNPVSFSILYDDIFHASYEEMDNMGLSRRILKARARRAIFSGILDALWRDGRAGDFIDRKSISSRTSKRMQTLMTETWTTVSPMPVWNIIRIQLSNMSDFLLRGICEILPLVRGYTREVTITNGIEDGLHKVSCLLSEANSLTKEKIIKKRLDNRKQAISRRKKILTKPHAILSFLHGTYSEDSLEKSLHFKSKGILFPLKLRNKSPYLPYAKRRVFDTEECAAVDWRTEELKTEDCATEELKTEDTRK